MTSNFGELRKVFEQHPKKCREKSPPLAALRKPNTMRAKLL